MCLIVLSFVVLQGGAKPVAEAADRGLSFQRCAVGAWAEPETLRTARGSYLYVERPSIVAKGTTALLVGAPAFQVSPRSVRLQTDSGFPFSFERIAGAVFTDPRRARPLGLPPGVSEFTFVRAAATADGVLHATWLAPSAFQSLDSTLWTSGYAGRKWSVPRVLSSETGYRWNSDSPSELRAIGNSLQIIVPAINKKDGYVLDYIQWRGRRTSLHRYVTTSTAYVTTAASSSEILLGYIATERNQSSRRGRNSVFFAAMPGDGERLSSSSQVVSSSVGGEAYDLRLLSGSHRRLYLTWRYTSADSSQSDSVQLAVSKDNGKTWKRALGLYLRGGVDLPSSVVLNDGSLSVVVREPKAGYVLASAIWKDEHWSSIIETSSRVVSAPATFIGGTKQVLVWGAPGPDKSTFPVTLVMTRELRCSS